MRTKNPTRAQKEKKNPHGKKNSKYQQKIIKRAKDARRANLPAGTPYPIIKAVKNE